MAFTQEQAWASTSITANAPSSTVTPTFVGGGAELVVALLIVDTSNGCTGATFGAHANLTVGTSYVGTAANNTLMVCCWATWNGAAGSPSLGITYTGGNSGTNGGKMNLAVFTGYASNIIASPGPSAFSSGSSATASTSIAGVAAGSLVVAQMDNTGSATFTAGAGYTLAYNTSAWFTSHITGIETVTGLSAAGGTTSVTATLTSNPWSILAVAFPPLNTVVTGTVSYKVVPAPDPTAAKTTMVRWVNLQNGNVGVPFSLEGFPSYTAQVTGVFGSGGSINFEGSNDGVNWAALKDVSGASMTKTSAGMTLRCASAPLYFRPNVTNGDGTTNLLMFVTCNTANRSLKI